MQSHSNIAAQARVRRLPSIALFALHQAVGTVGIIVLAGIICDALLGPVHVAIPSIVGVRASWLLTEIPGFPVQALLGFVVGFLFAREA